MSNFTKPVLSRYFSRFYRGGLMGATALLMASCSQTASFEDAGSSVEGYQSVDDLHIVDCLLPGQVRRLGNASYLAARRPIRTTAVDCRIRGGEYVAYDRADYRSALNVWLPQAEKGDAEAQNYVGEIFEKGLGQEPDYVSAKTWYERAAEQGYSRAQINLGYLYENGFGVEKSMTRALNLYRQASGLEGDDLMLSSEAQAQLDEVRAGLEQQLTRAQAQTNYLQQQIQSLETEVEEQTRLAEESQAASELTPEELAAAQQEIAVLNDLFQQAESDRNKLQAELDSMEVAYRSFSSEDFLAPQVLDDSEHRVFKDIQFGRYFALIIGNEDYLFMDDLRSPVRDAERLQGILEEKYGFSTLMVTNATGANILNTINDFYDQIGENDNLLIYYAGHGNITRSAQSRTERGYWLPVDASTESISNWINNAVISDHLDRLRARSVLVISDSCYAGNLGSEKSPFLFGVSSNTDSEAAIRSGLARRARVVISSGGESPVLDGSDSTHSVFASALVDALENNNDAMRDSSLFAQLSVNVRNRSSMVDVEIPQVPEMKPVREAGHEGGTFYFVPVN